MAIICPLPDQDRFDTYSLIKVHDGSMFVSNDYGQRTVIEKENLLAFQKTGNEEVDQLEFLFSA